MLKFCKLYLTILSCFILMSRASAQCAGGAFWIHGAKPAGTLLDTAILLGTDTVFVRSAGTFAAGRPGYAQVAVTWNGHNFQGLHVNRGASFASGTYTYYKLKIPLDSNYLHINVRDIRGDGFNTEHQRVQGFLSGFPVTPSFKDPVNGAFITGGNIINGAATTTSLVQSAMRVFFNSAVDSIVVTSTALSDFIVMELFSRCDVLLPERILEFTGKPAGSQVQLTWRSSTDPDTRNYEIERSSNGANFQKIGEQISTGSGRYSFADAQPLKGKNIYRLKQVMADGRIFYSAVLVIRYGETTANMNFEVYPNPFKNHVTIGSITPGNPLEKFQLFDLTGKKVFEQSGFPSAQALSLSLPDLQPGLYYLRLVWQDATINSQKLVKQ